MINEAVTPFVEHIWGAGNGGHAIVAYNTTLRLSNANIIPGKGGVEDQLGDMIVHKGIDGSPIVLNSNSQVFYETYISDWMLMR